MQKLANPQSALTQTAIVEKNFRSLEEFERVLKSIRQTVEDETELLRVLESKYLKSLTTAGGFEFKIVMSPKTREPTKKSPAPNSNKFGKIVVPDLEKLKSNFSLVSDLGKQLKLLDSLEGQLKVGFAGKPGAQKTLKSLNELRDFTEKKMDAALVFLKGVASKHVPKFFQGFIDTMCEAVGDTLTYKSTENYLYVHQDSGVLIFTNYMELNSVKDLGDNILPQVFIVLTCQITDEIKYFVSLLHEFEVPGAFSPGRQVYTANDATKTVGILFDLENFHVPLGAKPVRTDLTKKNFSMGQYIKTITPNANVLEFTLAAKVSEVTMKKVANSIMADIRVHVKGGKPVVSATKRDGAYVIKVTFGNLADDGMISVNEVQFLKERLGVPDDKLHQIVRIINGQ